MAERRARTARPVRVRVPVTMPDGSAPERWLSNIRLSSFTIMILALLVLGVIVLAPSLKLLIQQRSQIAGLEKSVAQQKKAVSSLKGQVARWDDPAYIEAQARNRLLFVFPGEYSYLVIPEPGDDLSSGTAPISKHIQTTKIDWVQALTSSVLRAGLSTETKTELQSPTTVPNPTPTKSTTN
ncbi:MAG TPA: septum formation initiator family protein [Galbitalea sp.]|nr:septum formation initiator family protein [Galbitalea sp.]